MWWASAEEGALRSLEIKPWRTTALPPKTPKAGPGPRTPDPKALRSGQTVTDEWRTVIKNHYSFGLSGVLSERIHSPSSCTAVASTTDEASGGMRPGPVRATRT